MRPTTRHVIRRGTRRHPGRGYFLMEMMFVIALLGLFLLVSGRVMVQAMRVSAESRHREEVAHRFDLAMEHLRADTWGAERIEADPADGRSVTLRRPGGATVTWRVEDEPADPTASFGTLPPTVRLVRTESPARGPLPQRWEDLPAGLTFAADGPALRVRAAAAPGGAAGRRSDELTLVSQLALAGRSP